MWEAVLPFLEYVILQAAVAVVGLNLIRDRIISISGVLSAWIFGQMLLFSVFQIIAVPMIMARLSFVCLFWLYFFAFVVLLSFGSWRLIKCKTIIKMRKPEWSPLAFLILLVALLLILYQAGVYYFGVHLDEDDARWLAEANDAIEYGNMLTRNFDTGEYLGYIQMTKDATSPWPMMIAVVSGILHTRTAVFAHTIYAAVEIVLVYCIYWLIAKELFKKAESKCAFFLVIVLLNLFNGNTYFTQSTFSLVRIWQGKATVAAVIVPLLFYLFLQINRNNRASNWLRLPLVSCAACLMSGMGIFISAIMIAIYGAYNVVAYNNWKRIPLMIIGVLPPVVFLGIYTLFQPLV